MNTTTRYVTIGFQYDKHHPHPSGYPITGFGWIEIKGCTYSQARTLIQGLLGNKWAFIYSAEEFNRDPEKRDYFYPEGCQLRITVETTGEAALS